MADNSIEPEQKRFSYILGRNLRTRVIIGFLIVFVLSAGILYWQTQKNRTSRADILKGEKNKTKYSTNQIVVQFKGSLAKEADRIFQDKKSFKDIIHSESLDSLNSKYKVKSIERVFKNLGYQDETTYVSPNAITEKVKNQYEQRAKRASENKSPQDLDNFYVIEFEGKDLNIDEIIQNYSHNPFVKLSQPNYIRQIKMLPNDPAYLASNTWSQGYADMWNLKNIQTEAAWDQSQGENTVVAVVDTGVDYNHVDLSSNIWINSPEDINQNNHFENWPSSEVRSGVFGDIDNLDNDQNGYVDDVAGWDFTRCQVATAYGCYEGKLEDNDPVDGFGHGTHIAGTIAALGNNQEGIIGVAPKSKIMAVQALNNQGYATDSDLAYALYYAANNGADVINMSWGGIGYSKLIAEAVADAASKGVVLIAAGGNDDSDSYNLLPANLPDVIAVSSVDHNDQKSDFSNYGSVIDVAAPGGDSGFATGYDYSKINILSLRAQNTDMYKGAPSYSDGGVFYPVKGDSNSKYTRGLGTSMASPHVAGLAALLISKQSNFSNRQITQTIQASADDLGDAGFDLNFGFGRINAQKTVSLQNPLNSEITSPQDKNSLSPRQGWFNIQGSASGPNFKNYELFYTFLDPNNQKLNWQSIGGPKTTPQDKSTLVSWDLSNLNEGDYLLRLVALTNDNYHFEDLKSITLELEPTYQLTFENENLFPSIDGNRVVWAKVFFNNNSPYANIYSYDFNQKIAEKISLDLDWETKPKISGDNVVYEDWTDEDLDIFLYNFSTKSIQRITSDLDLQWYPAISGNKIVWQDDRPDVDGIYIYDINTKLSRKLTNNHTEEWEPAISGNRVVYRAYISNQWDIYLYDLTTNQQRQITNDAASQATPQIYGDYIVWEDSRNTLGDIYGYDLKNNQEFRVTSNAYLPESPQIYSNNIVWSDYRNGLDDVFVYDLLAKTEKQITFQGDNQGFATIYQNRIVWMDDRNININLFYKDISSLPANPLTITKNVSPSQAKPGEIITYYLTYLASSTAIENAVIRDSIDLSKVDFFDTAGGVVNGPEISWNLGRVEAYSSGQKIFKVKVK